jgi:hypothetical protein
MQIRRDGEITAEMLRYWNLDTEGKPAPRRGDSKKAEILAYIRNGQGICRTPPSKGKPLEPTEREYMRHYVGLSWQRTQPGTCALRWCTRQLIGNGCGRTSTQHGQRIQSRSTSLKSSMTSCPQMSGYMPSGSRARPSAPIVGSTIQSCTGS